MLHWATERCPSTAQLLLPRGFALGVDIASASVLLAWQYIVLRRHAWPGAGIFGAAPSDTNGPCLREYELLRASFFLAAATLVGLAGAYVVPPRLGLGKAQALLAGSRVPLMLEAAVLSIHAVVQLVGVTVTHSALQSEIQSCQALHQSARHIFLAACLALVGALLAPALLWHLCFCAGLCRRHSPKKVLRCYGGAHEEEDCVELGGYYLEL